MSEESQVSFSAKQDEWSPWTEFPHNKMTAMESWKAIFLVLTNPKLEENLVRMYFETSFIQPIRFYVLRCVWVKLLEI